MATRKHILSPDVVAKCTMGLTSLLLVVYNVLRIVFVPVTHDEASSAQQIPFSYWDIMRLKCESSNIHILNTVLTKTFVTCFGNTPFWLRFDSLLAQIIFLVFSYLLCRRLFRSRVWQVSVFLALCLQPFMFEFWGLSRGYGLAGAFTAASVYYFLRFAETKKLVFLNMALYATILAVYANFSLLDYYCGVVCCIAFYLFITLLQKEGTSLLYKRLASAIIASAVLCLLVAVPISKLIADKEFYYGGNTGLVNDTITSVLRENLWWGAEEYKERLQWVAASILPVIAIMGIYYIIVVVKNGLRGPHLIGCMLWILFAAPLFGIKLQHYLMHTLYPLDRTAIYLVPLFILSFCYWLYLVGQHFYVPASILMHALTIFLLLTFVQRMNISTTRMWWYGKNDLVVLNRIMDETKNKPTKNKVAVYWIFGPQFDYYITTKYARYFVPVTATRALKDTADTSFDYYYLSNDCNYKAPASYTLDTSFYGGGFTLWRKNK